MQLWLACDAPCWLGSLAHTSPMRMPPLSPAAPAEDVFGYIQRDTGERCKFLVRASYLQIYNEVGATCGAAVVAVVVARCGDVLHAGRGDICSDSSSVEQPASLQCMPASLPATPPHCTQVISDLLKPESMNLVVREDRRRGVHVEGLSEWVVRSPAGARLPELDDGERGR